jgi:hypothetical protein
MGIVKRYYRLIRRAYSIIIAEILGISKDIALQMAFKAINDIARPNRLVLTLLVYSAYCYGSGILCHVVTCTSAGWHRRCGAAEPEYL